MRLNKVILIYFLGLMSFFGGNFLLAQDSTSNPTIDKIISIVKTVEDGNNFAEQLVTENTVSLPFGIIKQIGAARYIIAVDCCRFKPTGAYFDAYAAIDFPGTTKKIAFQAKNIKFNPKGVVGGDQARLVLASNHTIKINDVVSLELKNDGSNWVEWDCNGFKAINLKGSFVFNKEKLIPDPNTGDGKVTATFEIYTTDIHNFVIQTSISPFMIAGLKDWSFTVSDATVDMSELTNAPNMTFPAGYNNPNMVTPQMWTGFYLKALKIKLPTEISKTGNRTEINVNNLLIDNMGVTGLFQANNVFAMDEGTMSGWSFSLDEIGVGFVCNKLSSGHIKGKVILPVAEEQGIGYTADLSYNATNKETDYTFTINPTNELKFSVFSADVTLANTSQITVAKANGMFKPTAVLNGEIAFNAEKFSTNGGKLKFEALTIVTTAPYLTNGVFSLNNIGGDKSKTAKYPVSLNSIKFGVINGAPILGFGIALNIKEGSSGFTVATEVLIKGKIEGTPTSSGGQSYTKTKWKFDKVEIKAIEVNIGETAPFTLKGIVVFRDNDPVYGDGFFGQIEFSIKNVLPTPAKVTLCFGSKETYRYFYVDAAIPTNIPLGSIPITLTKIMGGMYYHMKPNNASQEQLIAASKNQSATATTALSYVPDNTISLGFKAGVGYAYSPSASTANGDVMLEVAFTSSGGLSFVKLAGDVYLMVDPKEREKAPIKGSVVIQVDVENKTFDSDASIIINAYNAITGKGTNKIHIDPKIWYVSVGKPSDPVSINLMGIVTAQSYFMIGNKIEPALAPPAEIQTAFPNSSQSNRNQEKLASGAGFCTGAKIYGNISKSFGFSFFQVYGSYKFGLGFDMMMMNYGSKAHCSGSSEKVGMNGWLAQGNMYLYMQGAVGIKGNIHFLPGCNCDRRWCTCKDFNKTVFSANVAALVSGKLPKPLYFSGQFACSYDIFGLVDGSFNFSYEYGSNCTPVSN